MATTFAPVPTTPGTVNEKRATGGARVDGLSVHTPAPTSVAVASTAAAIGTADFQRGLEGGAGTRAGAPRGSASTPGSVSTNCATEISAARRRRALARHRSMSVRIAEGMFAGRAFQFGTPR